MIQPEADYFQSVYNDFVNVSITRMSSSNNECYFYHLSAKKIKDDLGKVRLHHESVITFFENLNVNIKFNSKVNVFNIELNLGSCVLNREQAKAYSLVSSAKTTNSGILK